MTHRHLETFDCFGGTCSVDVEGTGEHGDARDAARWARDQLLAWHAQFSRFLPESELSRLNADPREVVPASPLMIELAASVVMTGLATGGLVDGTLVGALESVGYDRPLAAIENAAASPAHGARATPAGPHPDRAWAGIVVNRQARTIARKPGVQIDSGGAVKGLLADVVAGWLAAYDEVLVDCCGDLAIGGADPQPRDIDVEHPLDGSVAATLEVTEGGVATSGTTHRRWIAADGSIAHHIIDPSTGRPARTGLIQVTALAPTALEAETLAKWALLGGPGMARERLRHGGVIIDERGDITAVPSPVRLRQMVR